ncbi:DMT family transporter [Viridibacillus sp. FSL R5-0477]|uniref:Drug/metabolite exporter family protein n=1 Tax=Viridibacillus arenosi FSL R5-213 TaxID=1227360 RepID=W4F4C8_9BACL|nr:MULTISPECIES: DMT family transporter [Viridibacillus]ETT87329.1 drug/metabolite exporter family protein [Viridibacillus arenosi FSL R5-213]OMC87849.1 EamA family transporter [Viridibacillus sp. FSL H7-0596]OMC91399.1 EamA family transporter [Viridibacillus arenosi]
MNHQSHRLRGIILIISGAMLWGATGPLMEWVLSNSELTVPFMLTVRLVLAGIILLSFLLITKKDVTSIWRYPVWWRKLVIFGVLGMLGVQYSFVAAIDASNAVVATLLQFLAPIFIIIFVSISYRKWPPKYQVLGILGTLVGLFLLLTNASFETLLVSSEALLWGVVVGLTFAFYTLYPAAIMKEWGVLIVVGWGMLIGGIVLGVISRVWSSDEWSLLLDPKIALMLTAIIFFGTAAFVLFLSSMKYITAVETSVLSSMEPLTAMIISVIWLGRTLAIWQIVGIVIMLVCVTWLSIEGDKQQADE